MAIVGGLDLHRKQITYDVVDTTAGTVERGRVTPADRESFRRWLTRFDGEPVDLAVEGCTGWRFIVEECEAAGVRAHLAEPADVAGLRGRRQHAKTDRLDARHLRELLEAGKLPECWIPPEQVLEIRAKVRLYKDLLEERGGWQQRIHATLFHLGAPAQPDLLAGDPGRLTRLEALSPATRQATAVALRMIDALDGELSRLRAELVAFARRQLGCRELQHEYGIGALTSAVIWSELGDARRFANSRNAVRHTLPRPPDPARAPAAALGVVRGRPLRCQADLAGPCLLPTRRAAGRQATGRPLGRPQARAPLPPPAARSRRGRVGTGRLNHAAVAGRRDLPADP
jgi:transposase